MNATVEASSIILGLLGFLQVIFMFTLARIFFSMDKLFSLIDSTRAETKKDLEKVKTEHTALLETHYVTTGQLNTLEEKLIGQIKSLSTSLNHLTNAINRKIVAFNEREKE